MKSLERKYSALEGEEYIYNLKEIAEIGRSDKFIFVVEWFDNESKILKKYILTFYPVDKTLELFDLKNHRLFLRRTKIEGIELEDLFQGSIVNIFTRQMKVVEYGDKKTKEKFELVLQRTFCMVKPDVVPKVGEIISFMQEKGFKITKLKMGTMTEATAGEFYEEHKGQSYLPFLLRFMISGPCVAMEAIGENAIARWRELIGPTDSEVAKRTAPESLRARYGTDITRNGVHGSKDESRIEYESNIWFSKEPGLNRIVSTLKLKETTCCIVKPHAIADGNLGPILNYINEKGFQVCVMEMFYMELANAEEFFEIYKGVVPEYAGMVAHLTSGPCVAMEIIDLKDPVCTPQTFRKLCGPTDPDIARKLRPDTIRAKFGKTKILNAVHCTDLPEDAILEVEFFFKILQC